MRKALALAVLIAAPLSAQVTAPFYLQGNTITPALGVFCLNTDNTPCAFGPGSVTTRGGTSLATGQVSISTTATLLVAARTGRQRVTLVVSAANACAFGNAGVTSTTGLPLQPVAGATITLDTAAALYGVCSATTTVSFIELF